MNVLHSRCHFICGLCVRVYTQWFNGCSNMHCGPPTFEIHSNTVVNSKFASCWCCCGCRNNTPLGTSGIAQSARVCCDENQREQTKSVDSNVAKPPYSRVSLISCARMCTSTMICGKKLEICFYSLFHGTTSRRTFLCKKREKHMLASEK